LRALFQTQGDLPTISFGALFEGALLTGGGG